MTTFIALLKLSSSKCTVSLNKGSVVKKFGKSGLNSCAFLYCGASQSLHYTNVHVNLHGGHRTQNFKILLCHQILVLLLFVKFVGFGHIHMNNLGNTNSVERRQ